MIEKLLYRYDEAKYAEIFRHITYPGIKNGLYLISNYGRVYNIKKDKIMKIYYDKDNYERITLVTNTKHPKKRGNKSKHYSIHRLVAWEFLGPPPDELHSIVNHKNNIPCCNFVHNLEWCSVLENTEHAKKIGALNNSGLNSNCSKYDEKTIRKICSYLEDGYNNMEILELMVQNKNIKDSYGIYNLINKLSKKLIYWDIVTEYNYKVPKDFFNCNDNIQKIRDMIFDNKTNYDIMNFFGFKNISDNKKFYNQIIYQRVICKVLFNDYRKYKI